MTIYINNDKIERHKLLVLGVGTKVESALISELIDKDFPNFQPVTENIREVVKVNSMRHRGSVRICNGLFWTEEEYQSRRDKVLATPLP